MLTTIMLVRIAEAAFKGCLNSLQNMSKHYLNALFFRWRWEMRQNPEKEILPTIGSTGAKQEQ